jgi:hypothetical protein
MQLVHVTFLSDTHRLGLLIMTIWDPLALSGEETYTPLLITDLPSTG